MTEIYRDGLWQSVSEKEHPQLILPGYWRAGRWVTNAGVIRQGLEVLVDGVAVVGYAWRLIPAAGATFKGGTKVRFRVMRYPDDDGSGTYWTGWLPIGGEAVFYWSALHDDHKGGHAGHKYGADIEVTQRVKVDQFKLTLRPAFASQITR